MLDSDSGVTLYQQVFRKLRDAIESGLLVAGMKLPAIRELAANMECSRNTVETAYGLLRQEGYIISRPGYGYIVQDVGMLHQNPSASKSAAGKAHDAKPEFAYDFTYGNLQPGTFPASQWRTITDALLRDVEALNADRYTDPLGEMELRREIARQLNGARNIKCTPEQIVIQGGTEASVTNLLTLFDRDNDSVLMEDPGYSGIREAFLRQGFRVIPVPVEKGIDAYTRNVRESEGKLVYVTPSSQFPTCQVMPTEVRERLIRWACRNDAYILEDDYCREFRYRDRPLPPLASMEHAGRVVYMGTFSKSLSPALRMNYLVLPPKMLERWQEIFARSYSAVPWLSQAVLARFMHSGQWDRHIRRLHAQNTRKFNALLAAIKHHMGNRVAIRESGTGLHLLIDIRDGRSQDELIATAKKAGVLVYATHDYCITEQPSMNSCILIGFSAIPEEDIEPGIETLSASWFD